MAAPPLIVRCGAFGDIVLLTPLLRLLAARHDSKVDVVSSGPWTPALLANEPCVNRLQMLSSRRAPYLLCPSQWALVRWLRGRGRGPIYLCDVTPEMRVLLARGGVHPDDIVAREPAGEEGARMLWPDRWLELGMRDPPRAWPTRPVDPAAFRLPRLFVDDASRRELADWRARKELGGPLVLFQPGNKRTHKRGKLMTGNHSKHWDPEQWAAVAATVLDTLPDGRVLLCGSPPEHSLLEDIRQETGDHPRVHNLAEELGIPRLLALLEAAHSMVSVDTGPAHAAAALGCPLVVMFGAASPEQWRPIGAGPITVIGGRNGAASRVSDLSADEVSAAWKSLPDR